MEPEEDKQLARLYDYTKFHIGIYLSFAGGIAALLATEKAGWFLSNLVAPNKFTLYVALGLMVLAGTCGGMVASSTIECNRFADFWNNPQRPQSLRFLAFPGKVWAMLEHIFFWLSLLILGYTVAIGFANTDVSQTTKPDLATQVVCCCPQSASERPRASK